MADPFLEMMPVVEDRRRRLHGDINELQDALRRYDEVAAVLHRIKTPYIPMTAFSGTYDVRTMLVRDLEMKGGQVLKVLPLLVPEVIVPTSWPERHPNGAGTKTVISKEVAVPEVIDTLVGLYADGIVEVGTLDDVARRECPKCHEPGYLLCEHWLEREDGYQRVNVRLLCRDCPRVKTLAYDQSALHIDHPLLPRRPQVGLARPNPY